MAKKNWVNKALGKPGALHKAAGVKGGQKIPPKKLAAMAKGGGANAKKAALVLKLEAVNKNKKKK